MRLLELFDRGMWRRERDRWIEARPPGPLDGRDPVAVPGGPSRLVVARDDAVLDACGAPRASVLRDMLARGLRALTGEPDERAAWSSLLLGLRRGHVVGIKLNTVAVHLVPHRAVVDALIASLGEAGVRLCSFAVSSEKARRELRWRARPNRQGFAQTIRWIRQGQLQSRDDA